jgi:putative tryptophan/tyrosine transport system substrate-binding protein
MKRRTFVSGVGAMLAVPAAKAHSATTIARLGLLDYAEFWEPLRQGLSQLGYVEGKTIVYERRISAGYIDRLPALAKELVQRGVDVIVTYGTPATQAAKQATTAVPVVMIGVGEPVQTGLVPSLAKPAGNITGSTGLGADLSVKRLELVREVLPGVSRVALLWNPRNASSVFQLDHVQVGAQAMGMTLVAVQASGPDEFDGTFAAMMKTRPEALMVTGDSVHQLFVSRILQFVATHRLPTMYQVKENVIAGGLVSYGPSLSGLFRRAAIYVDKILKGARPSDLPVEQPTTFEFVINVKTAKTLGLTIPPSLLLRADQVIE